MTYVPSYEGAFNNTDCVPTEREMERAKKVTQTKKEWLRQAALAREGKDSQNPLTPEQNNSAKVGESMIPEPDSRSLETEFHRELKRGGYSAVGQPERRSNTDARVKFSRIIPGLNRQEPNPPDYFFCRTKGSHLFELPPDEACKAIPHVDGQWVGDTIALYGKLAHPIQLDATICAKKTEKIVFYVNLLGDRFSNVSVETHPVKPHECADFAKYMSCSEGPLFRQNEHLYSTHRALEIEFPGRVWGFFVGSQSKEVTNCFLEKTEVFLKRQTFELTSPTHDLSHCKYTEGSCETNGMRLLWNPSCGKDKPCIRCGYVLSGNHTGYYTDRHFVSKDNNFALTFALFPPREVACDGTAMRISEQGYGVAEKDYQKMQKFGSGPRRRKRDLATTEEIAAGLTAAEFNFINLVNRYYQHDCQARLFVEDNPTLAARRALQRPDVMARWIAPRALEVFYCGHVPMKSVKLRRTTECTKYVPVTFDMPAIGKIKGFLDPVLRILSATSPPADCRLSKYFFTGQLGVESLRC
jgi:hypothetical protein